MDTLAGRRNVESGSLMNTRRRDQRAMGQHQWTSDWTWLWGGDEGALCHSTLALGFRAFSLSQVGVVAKGRDFCQSEGFSCIFELLKAKGVEGERYC